MKFDLFKNSDSTAETVEIETAEQAQVFYPKIAGIRFNFVLSASAHYKSPSNLISNRVDRLVLKAIRQSCDLIVTSGETARNEELKASATSPMLILTKQSVLTVPALREPSAHPIFVTNNQANLGNPAALSIGFLKGSVYEYMKELNKNYSAIVLEVGVTLAKELVEKEIVDEVCLTVTSCPEKSKATEAAKLFLDEIGFAGSLLTLLNHEDTWLFRFKRQETH